MVRGENSTFHHAVLPDFRQLRENLAEGQPTGEQRPAFFSRSIDLPPGESSSWQGDFFAPHQTQRGIQ